MTGPISLGAGVVAVQPFTVGQPVAVAPVNLSPVPVLPVPGVAGPAGASAATYNGTAGLTLSGHRVVRAQIDGTLIYATSTAIGDATRDLFLTLAAADSGQPVTVQVTGRVTEPSWAWLDGPVYLAPNGGLTQVAPTSATAAYLRQIGHSVTPTSLFFNPQPPLTFTS